MTSQLLTTHERPLATVPGPQVGAPQVGVRVVGSDPLSREGVIHYLRECPDVRVLPDDVDGGLPAGHPGQVVIVVTDRVNDATVMLLSSIRGDVRPRVVLVVGHLDADSAASVVRAGAVGIMRRSEVTRAGLRQVVRSVVAGEAVVPPDVLAALLGSSPTPGPEPEPGPRRLEVVGLNDRETKVLRLLSDGSDTREIAHSLNYSERTVKTIIQDVTRRFGLRNRSHAVAYALRQGLI